MATMNISLPDDLKAFVEDQVGKNGFGTASEYVRAIIRDVQEQQAEQDRLDALLIEGLESGPATALTKKDWEHIRQEGRKLIAQRMQKRQATEKPGSLGTIPPAGPPSLPSTHR